MRRPSTAAADKPAPRPRAAGRAAPALDREHILAATLALIDRDGVAAFSLRVLAQDLGVFPTAIYWHVPSRNELISGAVALALAGVSEGLGETGGAWRQRLRGLFVRFRQALQRHPRLAPVIAGELISNSPLDLPMLEHIVQALEDAGFDGTAMLDAFNVTVAALCGFVALELAAAPAEGAEAWAQAHRERVAAIPAGDFPALSRQLGGLRDRAFILRWSSGQSQTMDSGFEAWVDVVIAGLEVRAARR